MATSNAATNYLERRILDFIFKNNALSFASPGNNIYVGLATAVSDVEAATGSSGYTEATFGSYARQQVPAAKWDTIGADSTDTQTAKNNDSIEFPASTGTSNTITHVIITDNASTGGGNVLFIGALDASKTIATGDIFRINANNLTIELK
tara:strand:- start:98 stop:547 length:450 start_codon:yes stop_codon:yes gene_type:complete